MNAFESRRSIFVPRSDFSLSRRGFLRGAASAAALAALSPAGKAAYAATPNEKINMAFIGVGWQGIYNLEVYLQDPDARVIAVCDVYKEGPYLGRGIAGREPARRKVDEYYDYKGVGADKCAVYDDYRAMLDEREDIDAVVITTPDHHHAPAALAALAKGKHVFCEKPLAHSLTETRAMTEAARRAGAATQMGNWGHGKEDIRLLCEWIWSGAIGDVREVHVWAHRPSAWWPYGLDRPEDAPPVPPELNWELWLGPAEERPYHPAYLPFIWRGWWAFGGGALGDMGCHLLDPVVWSLRLGSPNTVEATSVKMNTRATPFGPELPNGVVHPETTTAGAMVRWTFPARDALPPVNVTWYDGGLMPPRPDELDAGRPMGDNDGGVLFIGDQGKLLCDCYGDNPQILAKAAAAPPMPPQTLPRSIGHYKEFTRACQGGEAAGAHFDYSGPLTEIVMLGIAAIRAEKKLQWDPEKMTFVNAPDADAFLRSHCREGWRIV